MHDLFVYAGFGAGTPQQDYGKKSGTTVESCSFVAGFGVQKPSTSTTNWNLSIYRTFSAFVLKLAIYTPEIITNAPIICSIEKGSFNTTAPAIMDTTVETPIKDDIRFTPILAIATLFSKNARMEHPIP